MTLYVRPEQEVEAVQWSPGDVVHGLRMFRPNDIINLRHCPDCSEQLYRHGWAARHLVCPGDWFITGQDCPVKDAVFQATYSPKV